MAITTDISNDNKYLAIAEVNTSGTIAQSSIKIISMDKASADPSSSVIYTYTSESNELLINIKYQDRGSLICLYDNSIHVIEKEQDYKMFPNLKSLYIINQTKNDSNSSYFDINLKNNIVQVIEKNTGLFSTDTQILITNVYNKTENLYKLNSSAKALYTYGDVIAVNIGSEVHFIGTNGWLLKRYISSQEVNNIVLGDSIGGIIYNNKIEIIDL